MCWRHVPHLPVAQDNIHILTALVGSLPYDCYPPAICLPCPPPSPGTQTGRLHPCFTDGCPGTITRVYALEGREALPKFKDMRYDLLGRYKDKEGAVLEAYVKGVRERKERHAASTVRKCGCVHMCVWGGGRGASVGRVMRMCRLCRSCTPCQRLQTVIYLVKKLLQ